MADDTDQPSDRLRDRAGESRWKLWLLLEADRRVVVAGSALAVFGVLLAAGTLYGPTAHALRSTDSVDTTFQGFLTATITGVTLVLTLNQLVLSQELGAVGDQRERMDEAMAFRSDAADLLDAPVSPARPAQFLRALVQVSADCAREVREAADRAGDDEAAAAVDDLVSSLIGNAEEVSEGLDDARFGGFDVISSALNFNYSWKVFAANRIRATHGDALEGEGLEALDRLTDVLEMFGPAREHFKTLYFQWELINLSRAVLASALPALLVSTFMVAFFHAEAYAVTLFGVGTLVPLVAAAATVATVPFLVLLAYVLRIATVTKHTLSIGPFILRETDEVSEVEWNR
ncbi:hypothetical protein Hbl1158_12690 [Halobaculum sp. CBA1158]|uniref:hypothetical protein n=1 Tax=Halobaculum sp. CBA1158 TaxID=2904243 RepID=UPI001F345367|nr:hypothetical protein [Halobaculum sp. CBA1158]UIO99376.1 hypothetical protein Hbl1158_12690 [Halobaculum sp. CBA1158]